MATRTTIEAVLRAGILTGVVGLLPAVALGQPGDGDSRPSSATAEPELTHETLETRAAGAASTARGAKDVSDHAALEGWRTSEPDATVTGAGSRSDGVLDHAEAEHPPR